jgi:hypothetical protein
VVVASELKEVLLRALKKEKIAEKKNVMIEKDLRKHLGLLIAE